MAVNQITKVRMPDGAEVPLVDWSHRPLYSSIYILHGATDQEFRAFNFVESGQVSMSANFTAAQQLTATLAHTNISGANEMDATEEFLVYAIRVEMFQWILSGDVITNTEAGLPIPAAPNVAFAGAQLILELEVSEKAFPQAGINWFTAGMGPVVMATAAAAARTYANNGLQSREAVSDLVIPVHLGGTEDYSVIVHSPAGQVTWMTDAGGEDSDAVIQMRIYLDGLHKRAVA